LSIYIEGNTWEIFLKRGKFGMSDVKIDSSLVKITMGQKTSIKEQPALEKVDLPQFSIINSGEPAAKELETQLWQLRIEHINPWVAEQDMTSVKISSDISEPVLKHILLWPLREIAYKMCSYIRGGPPYIEDTRIIEALIHNKQHDYSGLVNDFELDTGFVHRIRNSIPVPNILRIYLCLDPNTLPRSEYRPQSISDNADQIYYSIKPWSEMTALNEKLMTHFYYEQKNYIWPTGFLNELLQLKPGEITYMNGQRYFIVNEGNCFNSKIDLHYYFASFGKDKEGIYLAIYDVWNFNSGEGSYKTDVPDNLIERSESMAMKAIGKPIYIYDRYYIPETDIKNELKRRAQEKNAKNN
jgi:hypothetical protein